MSAAYQAATEFQFSQWAKIWTNRRPGNFVHWPSTDAEAKALRESGKDIIQIALSATSQEQMPPKKDVTTKSSNDPAEAQPAAAPKDNSPDGENTPAPDVAPQRTVFDVRLQPNNYAIIQVKWTNPDSEKTEWVGLDKLPLQAHREVMTGPLNSKFASLIQQAQTKSRSQTAPNSKHPRTPKDSDAESEEEDGDLDGTGRPTRSKKTPAESKPKETPTAGKDTDLQDIASRQRQEEQAAKRLDKLFDQWKKDQASAQADEAGKSKKDKKSRTKRARASDSDSDSESDSEDDLTCEMSAHKIANKLQKTGQSTLLRSLPAGMSTAKYATPLSAEDGKIFYACMSALLSKSRWSVAKGSSILERTCDETSDDEGGFSHEQGNQARENELAKTVAKYGLSGRKIRKDWSPLSIESLSSMFNNRVERIKASLLHEKFVVVTAHFKQSSNLLLSHMGHLTLHIKGSEFKKVDGVKAFMRITLRTFDQYLVHLGSTGVAIAANQAVSQVLFRLFHSFVLSAALPPIEAVKQRAGIASTSNASPNEGPYLKVPSGVCSVSICAGSHPTAKCRVRDPSLAPKNKVKHFQELHDRWVAQRA